MVIRLPWTPGASRPQYRSVNGIGLTGDGKQETGSHLNYYYDAAGNIRLKCMP